MNISNIFKTSTLKKNLRKAEKSFEDDFYTEKATVCIIIKNTQNKYEELCERVNVDFSKNSNPNIFLEKLTDEVVDFMACNDITTYTDIRVEESDDGDIVLSCLSM